MVVVELLLRVWTALALVDPTATGSADGPVPLVVVAVVGCTAVAVVLVVAALVAGLVGLRAARVVVPRPAGPDLPTRMAWNHPDADGHVRSRAPGVVAPV